MGSIVMLLALTAFCTCAFGAHSLPTAPEFVVDMPGPGQTYTTDAMKEDNFRSCQILHYKQKTDHFRFSAPDGKPTFNQRYFFCATHWKRNVHGQQGPIFFYPGNEGPVELYVNNTGLMWENAAQFGALLVFAEHRYYGETWPKASISYLTAEQTMMDYVQLVSYLKHEHNAMDSPVVLFGGSYGGMLVAWLRLKYPGTFHGAIAGSAPLLNYMDLGYPVTFPQTVTYDASPEAGSAPACRDNVRATWPIMWDLAKTPDGRKLIKDTFRVCENVKSLEDVVALADLLQGAWGNMAMGNYPYASSYLTAALSDSSKPLPPFPVRVACSHLADADLTQDPVALLVAMREAAGLYLNVSGTKECVSIGTSAYSGQSSWDYQTCTEVPSHGGYDTSDGVYDMFYASPINASTDAERCWKKFGVTPMMNWHELTFGTLGDIARYGSNIVFSSGTYDPWYGAGFLRDLNPTMVAVVIEGGAHHIDLMYSHAGDSVEIIKSRLIELAHISRWIAEGYAAYAREASGAYTGNTAHSNEMAGVCGSLSAVAGWLSNTLTAVGRAVAVAVAWTVGAVCYMASM